MYGEQCGNGNYNHQYDAYFDVNNRSHWLESVLHAEHLTAQSWTSWLSAPRLTFTIVNQGERSLLAPQAHYD